MTARQLIVRSAAGAVLAASAVGLAAGVAQLQPRVSDSDLVRTSTRHAVYDDPDAGGQFRASRAVYDDPDAGGQIR